MSETPIAPNFLYNLISQAKVANPALKIITRFPPEPNGFLHIGHAKSIWINFNLAEQFNGQCYLRFDDTNPAKEEQLYIDSIQADIHWLGYQWAGSVHFTSDYFGQLYEWACDLIHQDLAYVDDSTADEMRQMRGTLTQPGTPSHYRERTVAENLSLFQRMHDGEFADGSKVLRAKIDMSAPNINLRDPVLYRIRHLQHHQTGNEWKIYPSYDFAHGQSDAIEGITHSICTLEFEDHRPLYEWLLQHLPVPSQPRQIEFARMNVSYTVTSKRKLKQLVDQRIVNGWDDPRMPTIAGLRRRGYTASSIRRFCEMTGVARANNLVDIAMLHAAIRSELEISAPRAFCILKPLKVILTNMTENPHLLTAPWHPSDESRGQRLLKFSDEIYIDADDFMEVPSKKFFRLAPGQEVRLRYAYVIRCDEVVKNSQGEIDHLRCTVDWQTLGQNPAGRKVKGVIHWISATDHIIIETRNYENLFTLPQPDKEEDFLSCLNPESLTVIQALAEPALAELAPETRLQFERIGYYCADRYDHQPNKQHVFNRIIGLKDSWAKISQQG